MTEGSKLKKLAFKLNKFELGSDRAAKICIGVLIWLRC